MQYIKDFDDYKLLDMADGKKLEKWGKYLLIRPDPQIIWNAKTNEKLWKSAHATYLRNDDGGGHWEIHKKLEDSWKIKYKELVFNIKPMGFKHTGLFPEQAVNWKYMKEKIKVAKSQGKKQIKVLNLFAYTGAATVACLSEGAHVCHVDSSKGIVAAAKENVIDSGLENESVRYIVDDVVKFVIREIKRKNKYDAIIMDPPSYGRGPKGEIWSIENNLEKLIDLCVKLLSDNPLFFLINTYTGGLSGNIIMNLLNINLNKNRKDLILKGKLTTEEIGIKMENSELVLPCGITTKWEG